MIKKLQNIIWRRMNISRVSAIRIIQSFLNKIEMIESLKVYLEYG